MADVAKEIMIRTVSGVLVVVIVLVILSILLNMKKPCSCNKNITPGTPITPTEPVADIPFFDGTNLTVQF